MISHSGPFVLAGDFNAKHTSWNNVKFDQSGCHLKKICDDNLCDIHFTNSPTAFPPTGPPSFLDLVISKNIHGISKPIASNQFSSDHLTVIFEIPYSVSIPKESKIRA